ncbi:MAG TPA: hypothetical protein VLC12_14580 [Terriglobales bacterium]|nr:hypothetical protein [Terriglobales bacterium]
MAEAPKPASKTQADRRRAWRAEAIGLLVIALAILLFTIVRYGARINWSAH